MITWLPNIQFGASARKLDTPRLVKMVEASAHILGVLEDGGANPEEVRMWSGYEWQLCMYAIMMANELVTVRRVSTVDTRMFHSLIGEYKQAGMERVQPPWQSDVDVIRSHRSRLIQADPEHFAHQFPGTPPNMPVLWPQPVRQSIEPCGYRLRLKVADVKRLNAGGRVLPEHLYYDPNKNEVLRRQPK